MRGAESIDVWKRSSAALSPKQVQVVRPKIDERAIVTRDANCNGKMRQCAISLESRRGLQLGKTVVYGGNPPPRRRRDKLRWDAGAPERQIGLSSGA